ncbi:MAG: hypothetical protein ACR2NZ_25365 [Rubripirellula sp.]
MLRREAQLIVKIIVLFLLFIGLLAVIPSLLGALMSILLIYALVDYSSRRYRNSVNTFNSALRSVCHRDGAIGKVALAFSRSGPISGPCYEYTRRLMMGEDPVEAAVLSRVPLQMRTAIAMQTPAGTLPKEDRAYQSEASEMALADSSMMPAYGQFIYLTVATLVTCLVLTFMSLFIVPTLEMLFEEFFSRELPYRWMFTLGPAVWILMLISFLVLIVTPMLTRGHLFGLRLPRWIPMMPRLAERNGEILCGLADGIDAGWPMGRALATGHEVSQRFYERRLFEHALRNVQLGTDPIEAIRLVGWIEREEAAWLTDASPARTSQLLRTIAAQNIRDARANLRWTMVILFPALLLLLGLAVAGYAFGFFATLSQLINQLS